MFTPLKQRAATAVRRPGQLVVPNRPKAPPPEPPEEPAPLAAWASFTRHADVNNFIEEANITPPVEWEGWTIAEKKTWLTESYGKS